MKLELYEKPKNVTILEAFPGYGLIGSIVAEYLLEHMDFKLIGKVVVDDLPPIVAIHKGGFIEPFGVYYNKEKNIVILHSINKAKGIEWKATDVVLDVAKQLSSKNILCIEGVMAEGDDVYFYCSNEKDKKVMKKLKIESLQEGIIVGVTGGLLANNTKNLTCLFAGTRAEIPDSMAASKILKVLNDYLDLGIDLKPLIKKAEEFEKKVTELLTKSQEVVSKDKGDQSYFG